ncbi:hypothetical protein ACQZ6B_19970 [Agrobacterium vitis]
MKQQEKVDGGESHVGLLLFGQATSTEPCSAECRHNPMPIKLVEASTPQPCLITPSDLHWFAACSEHFEELNEQLRHSLMFVMDRQTPSLHVIHKEKPPLLRAAVQMTRY